MESIAWLDGDCLAGLWISIRAASDEEAKIKRSLYSPLPIV